MKLASKIFLGSALVMVVLVGVGILSLRAVGHLAAVNRDIPMRALPTLGRAGAAHDAVLALVRLETRFLVLGDARYAALWDERAARVREDLAALRPLVRTAREQAVLEVAAGAFARYEAAVREERRLLKQRQRAEAIRLAETEARTLADQVGQSLEDLMAATHRGAEEVAGTLNPKQARLVAIIGESTERLLRLVNQILDLSRLRAGRLPLARRTLDLVQVAERGVNELRPQAAEGHVAVAVERIGQNFEAAVDEDKLVQVVVNLVANAIRFTPAGGRVAVRVVDAGPEVELHVEDTGVGIPAAALPRIFDMYQQAHSQSGVTGLGLAIVRGVVEAHNGRVTVESQEGKGSRFTVLLPRRRADA